MSQPENPNYIVRKAAREDMVSVAKMIKDLAVFEKMEEQVKIDANILQKDGFDLDSPAFYCLVAELPDKEIIGYALYYFCYSTWLGKSIFLEDLYVAPEHRKKGVGKELFSAVAKIALETSGRLDFHVLSWNPATHFYEKLGSMNLTKVEEWNLYRLTGENLSSIVKP